MIFPQIVFSRLFDYNARWIHLISWIQLILKNYLCKVLLTFHGKLWRLFTENNFLYIIHGYLILSFHAK